MDPTPALPPEPVLVSRCAWCAAEGPLSPLAPGEVATHGICAEHVAEVLRELDTPEKGG